MTDTIALYKYAEDHGIDVDWFTVPINKSMSLKLPDGTCSIALDPWKMPTLADENVSLAHELGHCETGSFYSPSSKYELVERSENRADKWAIKKLIPKDELEEEVLHGDSEVWSLAEHFGVTEQFMKKAMHFYIDGNIGS